MRGVDCKVLYYKVVTSLAGNNAATIYCLQIQPSSRQQAQSQNKMQQLLPPVNTLMNVYYSDTSMTRHTDTGSTYSDDQISCPALISVTVVMTGTSFYLARCFSMRAQGYNAARTTLLPCLHEVYTPHVHTSLGTYLRQANAAPSSAHARQLFLDHNTFRGVEADESTN